MSFRKTLALYRKTKQERNIWVDKKWRFLAFILFAAFLYAFYAWILNYDSNTFRWFLAGILIGFCVASLVIEIEHVLGLYKVVKHMKNNKRMKK